MIKARSSEAHRKVTINISQVIQASAYFPLTLHFCQRSMPVHNLSSNSHTIKDSMAGIESFVLAHDLGILVVGSIP